MDSSVDVGRTSGLVVNSEIDLEIQNAFGPMEAEVEEDPAVVDLEVEIDLEIQNAFGPMEAEVEEDPAVVDLEVEMDIDVSAGIDVNKSTLESTNSDSEDLSVNKSANDVSEFMSTQDDGDENIDSKPLYDEQDPQKKDQDSESSIDDCTTFPCSSNTKSSAGASMEIAMDTNDVIVQESTPHDNVKSTDPPCSSSQSLNVARMPVSAIKGSREKRGATPPQKLTVKWSPDVYDPVLNSVSHSVINKKPKRQSKKTSKSKQKNGSKSRGNKHKEKLSGRGGGG